MDIYTIFAITFCKGLISFLGTKSISKYFVRNLPVIARSHEQNCTMVIKQSSSMFKDTIDQFVNFDNKLRYLKDDYNSGHVTIIRKMSFTHAPKLINIQFSENNGETLLNKADISTASD